MLEIQDNREPKQTDTAAANLQISIQKHSRPSEFSRPLTSITLNLNGDLPVDRRRVSLLKGYFSLDDFYAWAACSGKNSKE